MLKTTKTVFVQYTINKIALINIIYFIAAVQFEIKLFDFFVGV